VTTAKAIGSKHQGITGAYTYRMVIGRATGDGEQTSIEIIANGDELVPKAKLGYMILDSRMFEQNERYQAFMELSSELPPELMIKVRQCNDLTFGRINLDQVQVLKRREEEPESGEGQS
jgi:hypothetical protein